jgi:putative ABC transport system ATP-binding protein
VNAPVVRVSELRFDWSGTPCLDIAELELSAGEQIFLHGPSGSGKSTLLNLLAGVLLPRSGDIAILGQSFRALSGSRRDRFRADHIGLIFQQFNLISYLSAMDNVLLPCRFSRRRRERAGDIHGAAARLLRHLDLEPGCWPRPATALSVGQQQRVAAARALIGTPELVIADEPTSALDAERQTAFLDLLAAECAEAGAALIFVSHDRRLSGRFSRELALTEINRT